MKRLRRGVYRFEINLASIAKVLFISVFLLITGSLMVLGGNVIIKNGDLNVTGNTLFSGNVGIGTNSPAGKLHIAGGSGNNVVIDQLGKIIVNNNAGGNNYIVSGSGGTPTIDFYTANLARLSIDYANGYVGIGTTSPADNLVINAQEPYIVVGPADVHHTLYSGHDGQVTPSIEIYSNNGEYAGLSIVNNKVSGSNTIGLIQFANANAGVSDIRLATLGVFKDGAENSGYFALATSNAGSIIERLRVDRLGNVGIGNSSPASKLTVAGIIESTSGGVKFPDGTTQTTAAGGGWTTSGSNLFSSNSGNVGINSNNPSAKLDVNGTVRTNAQITSTLATGTAPLAVASTTKVTSLNSDMLDGVHATDLNGDSVMYVTYYGGYPSCPGGWSTASQYMMYSGANINYQAVCYRTDVVCQVMYLTYYGGYPSCPGGWTTASSYPLYGGGGYLNYQAVCYRCGATPS